MTRPRLLAKIAALVGAGALLLSACGGSSSDDTLSDEEFCAELVALEEADDEGGDDLDVEALEQLRALADRAPNEDLSAALRTFGDIADDMSDLDEDDPEAFGRVMALMFDPEVMAAGETLETYLVDTCGFDESEFEGSDFDDSDFDIDDSSMSDGASGGTDLDSSALRDELVDVLDDLDADYSGTGVTIMGGTVSFDVYSADDVEAVEVCERMADVVDDDDLDLEVFLDDDLSAERSAGGSCEAA